MPRPTTTLRNVTDAAQMLAADTASTSLGIKALELQPGSALLEMTVTATMTNGHAIAHGGYVFLLADTAFACACNYPGPITVAASADIVFVSPAREGEVLTARATQRTRFGRSGIYDVTVTSGDRLVAEFRGISRTLKD